MRRFVVLSVFTALVFSLMAGPGSAKNLDSPAQLCKSIDNTFPPDPDRPFPFVLPSDGACASSVAQGFPESGVLTGAAFNAQCKWLESQGFVEYPYAFYGNPDYLAKNRADCKYFLSAFHFGDLPPGPGSN